MSDRKRNAGWRADNPNRHKKEIFFSPDFFIDNASVSENRRKHPKDKLKRKSS